MMPFASLMSTDKQVFTLPCSGCPNNQTKTVKAVFSPEGCSRLQNSRSFRVVSAGLQRESFGSVRGSWRESTRLESSHFRRLNTRKYAVVKLKTA